MPLNAAAIKLTGTPRIISRLKEVKEFGGWKKLNEEYFGKVFSELRNPNDIKIDFHNELTKVSNLEDLSMDDIEVVISPIDITMSWPEC
ncbi:MAG: hypothetical protein ACM3SM_00415 [Bacteroidota bacterium]